jgi:hypothetical protein
MTVRPLRFAAPRLAFAALLAAAIPAAATTIVPLEDTVLVDRASVIVVATAEGKVPATSARPVTEWLFQVEEVLKGEVPASAIVVRVTGGRAPDGRILRIEGAPRFRRGGRALLFLEPKPDGTYAIAQFLQGAFHEVRAGGRSAALRDLSEVRVIGRVRKNSGAELRDFAGFVEWIADRVALQPRQRDYLFRPSRSQLRAATKAFNLFVNDDTGFNYRWFTFDNGGAVAWRAHQAGQPGLPSKGFPEFQRGLAMWTNEATTPVRLTYAGTSAATAGFTNYDGQNVLLFDDPNEDIEGTYSCGAGGTLAIGGPWADSAAQGVFNNKRYVRIQGADVVMNDGIECQLEGASGSKLAEEVYAHELGHTLGLAHSSEARFEPNALLRDALMYFQAHGDGRGARLNSDDVAGLQTLYRKGSAPPPQPGGCPADTLCLLNGRFRVTATWENQFNNTSGAAHVPNRNAALPASFYNLSGFLYFDSPSNIELIVKVLDFGDVVKVFYGQLTNLRFTLNVTDTRSGQTKTYRNTAGDCGGFDNAGFPSNAIRAIAKVGPLKPKVGKSVRGTCRADADTLCLLNDRFAVEMTWRNQYDNSSGSGLPMKLSDLTGAFGFTNRANLELLVKTLEFPDRFLVIFGALSNLEYRLTLRDTLTGATETYFNAAGQYCGGLDNDAF